MRAQEEAEIETAVATHGAMTQRNPDAMLAEAATVQTIFTEF